MPTQSYDFFKNIQTFSNENDIFNEKFYHPLPDDWSIIVTDIKNSTIAIENGFYKDVNVLGVASIIAVKNACKNIEVPFVFGGDGALLFVPNDCVKDVQSALSKTKFIAADQFNMELRIAIFSYSEIKRRNGEIFIAKRKLSNSANIAMAKGSGLGIADELSKSPNSSFSSKELNFSNPHDGFVCKFAPIKPQNGEILTLIILANKSDFKIYSEILSYLKTCSTHLDLEKSYNTVEYSNKSTFIETKLFSRGLNKIITFTFKSLFYSFMTFIIKVLKKRLLAFDDLSKNTDQIKFDNTLRTILDVNPLQRTQILQYLTELHIQNKINFGYHVADSALLTCFVQSKANEHFHFIDGNHGGYTLAAKNLKLMISKSNSSIAA